MFIVREVSIHLSLNSQTGQTSVFESRRFPTKMNRVNPSHDKQGDVACSGPSMSPNCSLCRPSTELSVVPFSHVNVLLRLCPALARGYSGAAPEAPSSDEAAPLVSTERHADGAIAAARQSSLPSKRDHAPVPPRGVRAGKETERRRRRGEGTEAGCPIATQLRFCLQTAG